IKHALSAMEGTISLDRESSINLTSQDLKEYIEDLRSSGLSEKKINNILSEIKDIKIGSAMTAVLNGFVDIAKDPFITRGNWVTTTTNVANFLLRTGLHPLYVNAFIGQPILKEFAERSKTLIPRHGLS